MYPMTLSSGNLLFARDLMQLQRQLRHAAARIPAYSELASVAQHSESPLVLLEQFPELAKADLVEQGEALFDLGVRGTALFSETSGTTGGKPLVTPRSLEELRWNSRNISKAFERYVPRADGSVAIVHPGLMSPFVEASSLALYQIGVPFLRIYPIAKVCSYERIVRVLRDYRITTVMTTPTLANKLLYERSRLAPAAQSWSLQQMLLTGELLTRAGLSNTGRLLKGDATAFVYGSSESATCALGCSHGRYHPCLDDFAFELRPQPGAHQDGGKWELSVTWLNVGVRPLIRYRTGDIVQYGTGCECGEPGVWFEPCGRENEGPLSVMQRRRLDEAVQSISEPVYHYRLSLASKGPTLAVVVDHAISNERLRSVADALAGAVRDAIDLNVNVRVNPEKDEFYEFAPTAKADRVVVAEGAHA